MKIHKEKLEAIRRLEKQGKALSHEMLKIVMGDPILSVFGVGKSPEECEIHLKMEESHGVKHGKPAYEYCTGVANGLTNWKCYKSEKEALLGAQALQLQIKKKFKLELPIKAESEKPIKE